MNFDFNLTVGVSQSPVRKQFEGNNIYDVKFDGCEARHIQGQKDPTQSFDVLDIKFSNDDGAYTHTIFAPTEQDFQDTPNAFGGNNPSRVKTMMILFKHLIDAVNPDLAAEIDHGKKTLNTSSWDALRQLMIKSTEPGIGTETKIKLIKDNKGNASFPAYFTSYSKDGRLYMRTNFIGKNLFWTAKELSDLKKKSEAKPTVMQDAPTSNNDFDFDI